MSRSLSDILSSWFVKRGIWILLGLTVVIIIVAAVISWTSKDKPKSKTFKDTLRDAEDFLLDTVYGPDTPEPTPSAGPQGRTSGGKYESKGEAEARRVLREYFNRPNGFTNARPNFLNNTVTGGTHNLEIDCWEPELRLGVEYNGRQHYDFIPYFHKNKEAFMNQKYRDELKRRMCRDNGVTLIEIPYTVANDKIKSYLVSRLRSNGY